jgi:uncharacterized protein YndB with AHSA1/START domain
MSHIKQTVTIAATPVDVFDALTRRERLGAWWTECRSEDPSGRMTRFEFRGHGEHATFAIRRLEPAQLVQWCCVDSRIGGTLEWTGTTVTFELSSFGSCSTTVCLTHAGWRRPSQCYGAAVRAWERYLVASLKTYLETGTGAPYDPRALDEAVTAA